MHYVVRAKKFFKDFQEHSLISLHTIPLFHIYICIHVNEYLQEDVIHQGIVNLECIALAINIICFKPVLRLLEVLILHQIWRLWQPSFVKVQVRIKSRLDMCQVEMLSDHICQLNTTHSLMSLS